MFYPHDVNMMVFYIETMAKHNETGKIGEGMAIGYLLKMGYTILHQNWRNGHWEIDILATKNQKLHIIEVKTATIDAQGFPDDHVTPAKIKYLINAAEAYLYKYPSWEWIQFDIIAITLQPKPVILLIEDVYV